MTFDKSALIAAVLTAFCASLAWGAIGENKLTTTTTTTTSGTKFMVAERVYRLVSNKRGTLRPPRRLWAVVPLQEDIELLEKVDRCCRHPERSGTRRHALLRSVAVPLTHLAFHTGHMELLVWLFHEQPFHVLRLLNATAGHAEMGLPSRKPVNIMKNLRDCRWLRPSAPAKAHREQKTHHHHPHQQMQTR